MGLYLNPGKEAFEEAVNSEIFVDKTEMMGFLNSFVKTLLIHLGYLVYDAETSEVFIPNGEILDEFRASTKSDEWVDAFE